MKNTFFILLLLNSCFAYAQILPRCYTYDGAGNRQTKTVCPSARIEVVQDNVVPRDQVEHRTSAPKVTVYPNPSTGQIRIQVSGFSPSTRWSLTNIAGNAVLKDQALVNSDHDLSYLPAGTYYMRWMDGQKAEAVSLIIIND